MIKLPLRSYPCTPEYCKEGAPAQNECCRPETGRHRSQCSFQTQGRKVARQDLSMKTQRRAYGGNREKVWARSSATDPAVGGKRRHHQHAGCAACLQGNARNAEATNRLDKHPCGSPKTALAPTVTHTVLLRRLPEEGKEVAMPWFEYVMKYTAEELPAR